MRINNNGILLAVPKDCDAFSRIWTSKAETSRRKYGFNIDFMESTPQSTEEWKHIISTATALISSWGTPQINSEMLADNNSLKIIGHAAGSVADLVSPELYDRNIKVTTTNDIMAQEVASWCLNMTLTGVHHLLDYACIGGKQPMRWKRRSTCGSIQDASIGIWGYGSISKNYIDYLKPLNPKKILVCSQHSSEEQLQKDGLIKASLKEVFSQADVIVLLAGLTQENKGLVGAELLSQIKDGAVLLNCGRAKLVQQNALMNELDKQRFLACLDVFYEEPLPECSPIQHLPNVILTPHVGGVAGTARYIPVILDELHRYFTGQGLRYEVSRERTVTMTSHKQAFNK